MKNTRASNRPRYKRMTWAAFITQLFRFLSLFQPLGNTPVSAASLTVTRDQNASISNFTVPLSFSESSPIEFDLLPSLPAVTGYVEPQLVLNNNLHKACQAAQYREVKFLIENGANVDAMNDDRMTPLYLAASSGDEEMAALLLDLGADITKLNDFDQTTAFQIALNKRFYAIAKLIWEKTGAGKRFTIDRFLEKYAAAAKQQSMENYTQSLKLYAEIIAESKPADNHDRDILGCVYFNQARNYHALQRYRETFQCYERTLEYAFPRVVIYMRYLILLKDTQNFSRALEVADHGLRVFQDDADKLDLLIAKAHILRLDNQPAQALIIYKMIIVMDPSVTESYLQIGNDYMAQGDYLQALQYFEKGHELDPEIEQFPELIQAVNQKRLAIPAIPSVNPHALPRAEQVVEKPSQQLKSHEQNSNGGLANHPRGFWLVTVPSESTLRHDESGNNADNSEVSSMGK